MRAAKSPVSVPDIDPWPIPETAIPDLNPWPIPPAGSPSSPAASGGGRFIAIERD